MRRGHAVTAQIKIVSLKDRLKKGYEAELMIDQHDWDGFNHPSRLALLDHECCHVALVPETKKKKRRSNAASTTEATEGIPERWWKLDDLGMPRLRTVHGDWQGSDGFAKVCERHGKNALEFLSAILVHGRAQSAVALFDNSPSGPPEKASDKVKRERGTK